MYLMENSVTEGPDMILKSKSLESGPYPKSKYLEVQCVFESLGFCSFF